MLFIGSAVGSTSASLSGISWQVGDIAFVAHCRQNGSGGDPTMPAGWTDLGFPPAYTLNFRLRNGYRVLQSGDTATGSSTNATETAVVVYRDYDDADPIGNTTGHLAGEAATITYPALTLEKPGPSWVLGFCYNRSTVAAMETPPSGMPNLRANHSITGEVAVFDTGAGVSTWASADVNTGTSVSYKCTRVIELRGMARGRAQMIVV